MANSRCFGQPLLNQEAMKAANAVTALTTFAAVGVVDAKEEIAIFIARLFGDKQLIATNTMAPVSQKTNRFCGQLDIRSNGIHNNKIIAERMHLHKRQSHTDSPARLINLIKMTAKTYTLNN